ncbi:hypothetical protein HOY80DRAFT_25707, partial [Tuber brumale]
RNSRKAADHYSSLLLILSSGLPCLSLSHQRTSFSLTLVVSSTSVCEVSVLVRALANLDHVPVSPRVRTMSANKCQPTYNFHFYHGAQPAAGGANTPTNQDAGGKSTMKAPTGGNATKPTKTSKKKAAQNGKAPNNNYAWAFGPGSQYLVTPGSATNSTAVPARTGQPAVTRNPRWAPFVPASAKPSVQQPGKMNEA